MEETEDEIRRRKVLRAVPKTTADSPQKKDAPVSFFGIANPQSTQQKPFSQSPTQGFFAGGFFGFGAGATKPSLGEETKKMEGLKAKYAGFVNSGVQAPVASKLCAKTEGEEAEGDDNPERENAELVEPSISVPKVKTVPMVPSLYTKLVSVPDRVSSGSR